MVNADDVLRNSVEYDHRPVVIIGTEKRHGMCKKKLPQIFNKLGRDYDESLIHYETQESLKQFATDALEKIANGETLSTPTPVPKPKPKPKPIVKGDATPIRSAVKEEDLVVETEEEVIPEEDAEVEEQIEQVEEEVHQASEGTVGVCRYGVPKFKVEYITPNVLGLQESITVKVDEEDIGKFFVSVKNRVLNSISND